jgi:hypothetical protein
LQARTLAELRPLLRGLTELQHQRRSLAAPSAGAKSTIAGLCLFFLIPKACLPVMCFGLHPCMSLVASVRVAVLSSGTRACCVRVPLSCSIASFTWWLHTGLVAAGVHADVAARAASVHGDDAKAALQL